MKCAFHIGQRQVGDDLPCFIIAEAGVNHNGSLALAFQMIDAARASGVDAVKFQSFSTEELVTNAAVKADYQAANTGSAGSQMEMLKALELSWEDHVALKAYAQKAGILFLSTPFESRSLALLARLGVDALKISSTDSTNLPFIEECATLNVPIILSTGMCTLAEVHDANAVLKERLPDRYALLHCTTNYPAAPEDVNLRAMLQMKEKLKCVIGYSDHTSGLGASPYAVALGASIIEKHFTLDRSLPGPDHKASLLPHELANLVREIRLVEQLRGDGQKRPTAAEERMRPMVRKSIVAAEAIPAGTRLEARHLAAKRPATGLSPARWKDTLGRTTTRALMKDEPITENALRNGERHG